MLQTQARSYCSASKADLGRLAIGNQVHIVGHLNNQLVHRRSADNGVTWTSPDVISAAAGNFPAMYGGLFAQGDSVYLITAAEEPQNTGIDRNHEHVSMGPNGAVHFIWRHGDGGDSTPDPAGYMSSP